MIVNSVSVKMEHPFVVPELRILRLSETLGRLKQFEILAIVLASLVYVISLLYAAWT
jgi:hypothetical protein